MQIPDPFRFLFKPKRFKIAFGGRGSGKSESFARYVLVCMAQGQKWLCLREFMNSLEDSVHSMLKGIIELEQMQGFQVLANEIRHESGGYAKYGQLARNIASIKSKFDYDGAWIEEGETITEESLDVLEPTLRKDGSEILITFNPVREDGAVYARFVKPFYQDILRDGYYSSDLVYVAMVNMDKNPFAPAELIKASEAMKAEDYDKWLHVYGGEPMRDLEDVIIQPKWVDAAIDAHKKMGWDGIGVKVIGFDPADGGADAKAVAMRHGSVITKVKDWTKGDVEDGINRAFSYADDWRADQLVFDGDGLGAAVKVGLSARIEGKALQVIGYHGGASVDNPGDKYQDLRSNKDTFKNKRAQYWWYLRDRFEATYRAVEKGQYLDPEKLISLSSDGIKDLSLLKSELTQVKRKLTNNSIIQIESKADMAKRGVKSPNMADAIVMAFANPPISDTFKELEFDSLWQ